MVIMFIFLALTVIFIIGTAVYLTYKRKKQTNSIKSTETAEPKPKKRKSKRKLSDILEFKIKDNIIYLGNRYSSIISLGSIDYNMLSDSEQESVENVLIQTALAIDYPIQFFSTTEFIDTSKVISLLKSNKINNIKIQEYKNYLIEYLQELMENRTISIVKSYAIISYDGLPENAINELNRRTLFLINSLMRAKITCKRLTENEIYNLLYRELNKNSSLNINHLKEGALYVKKKQKTKEKRNKHIR